jgi:hypothetical protein
MALLARVVDDIQGAGAAHHAALSNQCPAGGSKSTGKLFK